MEGEDGGGERKDKTNIERIGKEVGKKMAKEVTGLKKPV
jgi:hypothetical protein